MTRILLDILPALVSPGVIAVCLYFELKANSDWFFKLFHAIGLACGLVVLGFATFGWRDEYNLELFHIAQMLLSGWILIVQFNMLFFGLGEWMQSRQFQLMGMFSRPNTAYRAKLVLFGLTFLMDVAHSDVVRAIMAR